MDKSVDTVENWEHAMDALFASLHSSAVAVREGLVTDPCPPRCPRCHRLPVPGRRWCDCGLRSILVIELP